MSSGVNTYHARPQPPPQDLSPWLQAGICGRQFWGQCPQPPSGTSVAATGHSVDSGQRDKGSRQDLAE